MTDTIDRRKSNLSIDKKTISAVLTIITILGSMVGVFYTSRVTDAQSFSDDRSRITKVETQVSSLQDRIDQEHSDTLENNTEVNKKLDALLLNQGLSPTKISAAK